MASVLAKFTFSCPHCDKVLKTGVRPAADKKIKCPACGKAFLPELDDEIQERPALKGKSKAASKTSVNGKANKKPRRDDDEDEAEEKSGGKGMLFGLLGCGALVLLLGCGGGAFGVTGWVWPGFMVAKKVEDTKLAGADKEAKDKGAGQDQKDKQPVIVDADSALLAAYIPADATILLGANTKVLRDKKQLVPMLKQLESMGGPGGDRTPEVLEELIRESDRMQLSVKKGGFAPKLVIAILAPPAVVAKFKREAGPGLGAEVKLGTHAGFRPGKAKDWPSLVAFPSDRIVLLAEMGEPDLIVVMDKAQNKQVVACPAAALSKAVEQSPVWGAWSFDDADRRQFQDLDQLGKQLQKVPESAAFGVQLESMGRAMQRAKGGNMIIDDINQLSAKVQVTVECQNPADATSVKTGAETFKQLFSLGALLGGGGKGPPPPQSMVQDVNSMVFKNQGNQAVMNMQLTMQTLTDLAKLGSAPPDKVAKKDDFPPFKEKEFPPVKDKDGPPKSKLMNPPTPQIQQKYEFSNMLENGADERGIQLNKGQRIVVEVTNNSVAKKAGPQNNVDFYVYRGDSSDVKNIIAYDQKPLDKDRSSHINRVVFDVPATGPFYIRVVNKGPGRTGQCIVQIFDFTGKDISVTPPAKEKDKDTPKINPNAKAPPLPYALPNFKGGSTDEKLLIFQPNKEVKIGVQWGFFNKKSSADVEITVLKGEKGNEVVAQKRGAGGALVLPFTPADSPDGVYRVRIHNRGPNTPNQCVVAIGQAQ